MTASGRMEGDSDSSSSYKLSSSSAGSYHLHPPGLWEGHQFLQILPLVYVSIDSSSNPFKSASSNVGRKELAALRKSFICFHRRTLIRAMASCCLTVGLWGNLLISNLRRDLGDFNGEFDLNFKRDSLIILSFKSLFGNLCVNVFECIYVWFPLCRNTADNRSLGSYRWAMILMSGWLNDT